MIRTTVMLPTEVHARLRRLARRRGVPLAQVIRESLSSTAEEAQAEPLSIVGAVSVAEPLGAASAGDAPPRLTSPVTAEPSAEEIAEYRARAAKLAAEC